MTADYNGWNDAPEAEREAIDEYTRQEFEQEALLQLDVLHRFALRLAGSREVAEDLVSETMLRALARWEQYQPGSNIRGWLCTILRRLYLRQARRAQEREAELPHDQNLWQEYAALRDDDPESRFYQSFVDEEITQAIDSLPETYRTTVLLSDLHELRGQEVASILGVPEGTVKSRLFRAHRMLQTKLRTYARDMGYGDDLSPAA